MLIHVRKKRKDREDVLKHGEIIVRAEGLTGVPAVVGIMISARLDAIGKHQRIIKKTAAIIASGLLNLRIIGCVSIIQDIIN